MVDIVTIEQDFEDCKRTRSQLADTCVELRKEIERLRAALEQIANAMPQDVRPKYKAIARQALADLDGGS